MSEEPIRLQNAQQAIREAYFEHESGLFTLNCVPGSGKSVVAHHIAAEDILRRYVAGDTTPEQHVAVVSFNRNEASNIVPEIRSRLRELVEHDLVPAASQISTAELDHLVQRLSQAPHVGTIDSILRDVLSEIAVDLGFDEMPTVGNEARLQRLHATCYTRVREAPDIAQRLDRLEAAYPDAEYKDSVREMLTAAVSHCRDRRLSTREFRAELDGTLEDVYEEGRPESFDDVVAAVQRCIGTSGGADRYDDLDEGERERIGDADARLHDDWQARLDDFCTVLPTYRRTYRRLLRDTGVVSHTDVAYLVDAYFDGRLDDRFEDVNDARRERVRARYHTRVQSLIIDEAQDVSAIQHAALSHLVAASTRVFCAGDLLQSIYLWRHADPTLFETATVDGTYLGHDWDVHEHRTATTTYRCLPDVARAINEIAEPVLTDPTRGDIGDLDVTYPGLDADRKPTDERNVHVAAFDPMSARPDSYAWVDPVDGIGEADILATLLSNGLGDGTFTDENGERLGITVLFRWSSKMETYEETFVEAGLSVRNASESLFECNVVRSVLDVCKWLVAPMAPDRTRELVLEAPLGLEALADEFEAHEWDIDAVRMECALTDDHRHLLDAFVALRERCDSFRSRPAAAYVEDVIERLALRADPHDMFEVEPSRRIANLDALVETLEEWEADDHLTPAELTELLDPFRENAHIGPNQPSTAEANHDIEFRTIHDMKGDQDDVVVIANPGFDLWKHGPHAQRFITQGRIAGLAPPTDADTQSVNADTPTDISLPPYRNGLYDPDDTRARDVGLRWATAHWSDDLGGSKTAPALVGPERLRRTAANERAEGWRLLYVALTRARDHLVIPLPRSDPHEYSPRDRWLDAMQEGLAFTGDESSGYTRDTAAESNDDAFEIGINDVTLGATWSSATPATTEDVAITAPRRDALAPWIPRFVNPSTMYPLTEAPEEHVLDHLLGRALHTDTNDVPEDIPLQFDRLGPDDVGTCLHEVLTRVVERELSEDTLRSADGEVRHLFDEVLDDEAPRSGVDERESLFAFFREEILDEFLGSALWERLQCAVDIAVETPIDGLVTIDGVEVELHGTADFVIETASGDRHVADVKIALTDLTPDTRRRYELQVAAYAYLFEQHEHQRKHHHEQHRKQTAQVRRTIETFGVQRDTITSSWPPAVVERRLAMLLDL